LYVYILSVGDYGQQKNSPNEEDEGSDSDSYTNMADIYTNNILSHWHKRQDSSHKI